jgi:hypothetical protein
MHPAAQLGRLLLTDFGEGAMAAEFDAVAVQALALMGAKDDKGRVPGDAEFMSVRPVKNKSAKKKKIQKRFAGRRPTELVFGASEALDGAVAAGLLERLTEGYDPTRFSRWVKGAVPSGADTGDAGDAGEGAIASAGDTVAGDARVLLVTLLLNRATIWATRGEAPESALMLQQL